MITNITIGKKLRELRKKLGISRVSIADMISVSESAIKLWETGTISPSSKTFKKYLDFMDKCGIRVDLDWLLDDNKAAIELAPKIDQISYIELTNKDKIFVADLIKILEEVASFCYYLDEKERVVYFNSKIVPFLIEDPKKIYNVKEHKLVDITSSDMYECCLEHYKEVLKSKTQSSFDYRINDPFGKVKLCQMKYIPLHGISKDIIGVMGFLSDRTNE
jgi:transcriptional regulator with XRE-family HTH domain